MRKSPKEWGKILVAVRLEKYIIAQSHRCIVRLVAEGLRPGDRTAEIEGKLPSHAANHLARLLVDQSDCDSILYIDSDADFAPDTLERLRSLKDGWDYDIFQPFVTGRRWPPAAVWLMDDKERKFRMKEIRDPAVTEEVAGVGLHFTLFRREIFEDKRLARPWFRFPEESVETAESGSEDLTMCLRARELGYSIGATTKVRVGHFGDVSFGWETFQLFLQDRDNVARITAEKQAAQDKIRHKVPPKIGAWGFDLIDTNHKKK